MRGGEGDCFYVYSLTIEGEEQPFYIGKGKGSRAWEHERGDNGFNHHKNNKIKKAKRMGLRVEVVIIEDGLTEQDAFLLEKSLIKKIGRLDVGLGPLLNLTDGGEGVSNPSQESIRKRRIKLSDLVWINNGIKNKRIKSHLPIPEGWSPGVLREGDSDRAKGRTFITNGGDERFVKLVDPIPDGWRLGRSDKSIVSLRDSHTGLKMGDSHRLKTSQASKVTSNDPEVKKIKLMRAFDRKEAKWVNYRALLKLYQSGFTWHRARVLNDIYKGGFSPPEEDLDLPGDGSRKIPNLDLSTWEEWMVGREEDKQVTSMVEWVINNHSPNDNMKSVRKALGI